MNAAQRVSWLQAPGELVLDIGAGEGALTAHMVQAEARVVAVEPNPRRASVLRERFRGVTVVQADAAASIPLPVDKHSGLWLVLQDPGGEARPGCGWQLTTCVTLLPGQARHHPGRRHTADRDALISRTGRALCGRSGR